MPEFRPIFLPFFAKQRRALLAAKSFEKLPISELVQEQLDNLEAASELKTDTSSVWRSSLLVAKPLIVKTIFYCSLSALLALASVVIIRNLLGFELSFISMAAICLLIFAIEVTDHSVKYFDMIRRADIARLIQLHLIARIHSKISKLESSTIGKIDKGNLKTLVSSDVEAVEDFITAASANWIPTLCLLLVMTPYLYYSLGVVGLIGTAVTLLQIPASMFFALMIEKLHAKAQAQQDQLASLVGEWVRHIRLVRVLGWQDWIANRISNIVKEYTTQTAFKHTLNCITYGLSFGWWLIVAFSMLIANKIMSQPLPMAEFFSSLWALGHLSNYVQFVPYAISHYGAAAAGAKRLKVFFDKQEAVQHLSFEKNLSAFTESDLEDPTIISFENVSVIFDGRAVLDNLNCTIDLSKRTAIIGEVASGKSIFLEVLLGERFPDLGSVYVHYSSGQKKRLLDPAVFRQIRSLVAYCPAEPYISNASLEENIDIWGKSDAKSFYQVLEDSLLTKDIRLFKNGISEEIGEQGINLSGGQKQRTSLARSFLSGRKIFALDDPLSAVDVNSEEALFEKILSRAAGMVLVSHRLSHLHQLDWLLVLENGRIVEEGEPQHLLNNLNSEFNRYKNAHRREFHGR